jgi:hypothetical protein
LIPQTGEDYGLIEWVCPDCHLLCFLAATRPRIGIAEKGPDLGAWRYSPVEGCFKDLDCLGGPPLQKTGASEIAAPKGKIYR